MDNGQTPAPDAPIHPPQFPSGALAPPARTLMDILQATAKAHPGAPASDDGQRVESYAELLDEVKDKARRLHEQGLGAVLESACWRIDENSAFQEIQPLPGQRKPGLEDAFLGAEDQPLPEDIRIACR
ncbi:hypothetical protein [Glutamicibacter sp. HZAU]|uniref:hypothetical protein n=1 Tax=Glutamicibacter sp. HZAU TaxID=2049891 RepID=UPI001F37C656|nr:hypothetical protein [Glutamicibacter sp. HZAU]